MTRTGDHVPPPNGAPQGGDRPGGRVLAAALCVLAPNPGPLTLDGTNTWVLGRPGAATVLVVDPGPDDEAHLRAVLDAVAANGSRVGQVLLTHGHLDHSAGARRFAELTEAPVRALDPRWVLGGEGLRDGDVVHADGVRAEVVGVPGHTADSLAFVLVDEALEARGEPPDGGRGEPSDDGTRLPVLTGDTVLGRGTSVVAWPDGRLADYLASLARLRDLARARPLGAVLPGHGPALPAAEPVLTAYLAHRAERLAQVRTALAQGARSAEDVVRVVYADLDPQLWPAAERSVRAQLDYLQPPA